MTLFEQLMEINVTISKTCLCSFMYINNRRRRIEQTFSEYD